MRLATLGLLLFTSAALAAKPRIVVLKSADLAPYAAVTSAFTGEAKATVEELTLDSAPDAASKAVKKLAENPPSLVLAVGPAAAVEAKRQLTQVPLIFVMVPYFQKYELEAPNVTGIALTSDLTPELTALHAMLPKVKRVGIVEDPRWSQKLTETAAQAAGELSLSVVAIEVDAPARLDKALKAARPKIDALVMISDRTVGNTAVIERLISFSADEKLPLVALAPGQVKAGALFAVAPSPSAIGAQAGRLANRVLIEKIDPGALAVAPPEGTELFVNWSQAKKLDAPQDFAAGLLGFAASKGLVVRPSP
ncbi:MAG: ABC transporter substrate binding protein [Myxococcaceae bacterium]